MYKLPEVSATGPTRKYRMQSYLRPSSTTPCGISILSQCKGMVYLINPQWGRMVTEGWSLLLMPDAFVDADALVLNEISTWTSLPFQVYPNPCPRPCFEIQPLAMQDMIWCLWVISPLRS